MQQLEKRRKKRISKTDRKEKKIKKFNEKKNKNKQRQQLCEKKLKEKKTGYIVPYKRVLLCFIIYIFSYELIHRDKVRLDVHIRGSKRKLTAENKNQLIRESREAKMKIGLLGALAVTPGPLESQFNAQCLSGQTNKLISKERIRNIINNISPPLQLFYIGLNSINVYELTDFYKPSIEKFFPLTLVASWAVQYYQAFLLSMRGEMYVRIFLLLAYLGVIVVPFVAFYFTNKMSKSIADIAPLSFAGFLTTTAFPYVIKATDNIHSVYRSAFWNEMTIIAVVGTGIVNYMLNIAASRIRSEKKKYILLPLGILSRSTAAFNFLVLVSSITDYLSLTKEPRQLFPAYVLLPVALFTIAPIVGRYLVYFFTGEFEEEKYQERLLLGNRGSW